MKSPIVSFIIPMYNEVERIQQCVHSIQLQTFTEIEIIVVDDGSTDGCARIVAEMASLDSRIRLLSFENGGTAVALNRGLEAAQGKYLAFSGADDWIEPIMLADMLSVLNTNGTDLVVCDILKHTPDKIQATLNFKERAVHKKDLLEKCVLFHYDYSICNKLYPRQLIIDQNIRFDPVLRIGQDVLFNFCVFARIHSVSVMPDTFYHYVSKEGSLMTSAPEKRLQSFNRIITEFEKYCNRANDGKSWGIFQRYIGVAYQSYFFNIALHSGYSSSFSFWRYFKYLMNFLTMMHPLLVPLPEWSPSVSQRIKNKLLSKRLFKLFALLAAVRHKTVF